MTTLSDRIKECLKGPPRKTQKALADACGIEAASVNDWVSGKTKSINAENLFEAANFLNVEPKWLATGHGNKYKPKNAYFNDEEMTPETEIFKEDDEFIKKVIKKLQSKPKGEINVNLAKMIDTLIDGGEESATKIENIHAFVEQKRSEYNAEIERRSTKKEGKNKQNK